MEEGWSQDGWVFDGCRGGGRLLGEDFLSTGKEGAGQWVAHQAGVRTLQTQKQ